MVAATVMVFAITTSITTMQSAFLALDSARNTTLAGQILQSEFEKMRLKDWNTVVGGSGYAGYEYNADGSAVAQPVTLTIDPVYTSNAAIGNRFTLTRTVSDVHTDMKKITLLITWRGYDGRSVSRSYYTYYGKNGLYDFFYNSA
jgi:hypothetical protein